jgi:hypothetical protein
MTTDLEKQLGDNKLHASGNEKGAKGGGYLV